MPITTSFLNGGNQVTASRLSSVLNTGKKVGLFESPTLTYSSGALNVSNFTGHIGNFSISYENDSETIDLTTYSSVAVSSNSYQGTLVVIPDSEGYFESKFDIVSGLLSQDAATELGYLVVGWFAYPGSSVALTTSQWTSCPVAPEKQWLWSANLSDFTVPNTLTVVNHDYAYSQITNSSSSTDVTFSAKFIVPTKDDLARTVRFVGTLAAGCYVKVTVNNQALQSMSSGDLKKAIWSWYDDAHTIPVAPISQSTWDTTFVKVDIVIAAGATIQFGLIGATNEISVP